jgi:hypothetical protein
LYDLSPPRVTTLYGLKVPEGPKQRVRYDDGTGDELEVPLGTTAFVSGRTMFDILPKELKSAAVRGKVKYAPHPYVWMAPAKAVETGLGIKCEGLEVPFEELPPWEESKRKTFPMVRFLSLFVMTDRPFICRRGRIPLLENSISRFIPVVLLKLSSSLYPRDRTEKVLFILMEHISRI